jgi:very-short-patch-repair endonuclease
VRGGRWQQLQHGVYATFSGEPHRDALLWAALIRAGSRAVLSHNTAAELLTLIDAPSPLIHLTIPVTRKVRAVTGAIVHRSARVDQARHPALLPPRTRIEETVLDLVQQASTFDGAFHWASAARQRRLTTADRLLAALGRRGKQRWRDELVRALGDVATGVHSVLERRYLTSVERPHRLPRSTRQARLSRGPRSSYLDNLYQAYSVCVELEGLAAHPDDRRWQDSARDNAGAADGLITLRYNWAEVTQRPCQTAAQIARALSHRGWPGSPRRCGERCAIGAP